MPPTIHPLARIYIVLISALDFRQGQWQLYTHRHTHDRNFLSATHCGDHLQLIQTLGHTGRQKITSLYIYIKIARRRFLRKQDTATDCTRTTTTTTRHSTDLRAEIAHKTHISSAYRAILAHKTKMMDQKVYIRGDAGFSLKHHTFWNLNLIQVKKKKTKVFTCVKLNVFNCLYVCVCVC